MKVALAAGSLLLVGAAYALYSQSSGPVCLGEFTTSLNGRTRNQAHNAVHALSKLKAVSIKPGESFSFNLAVGTYTIDAGYRKAPVSYNGTLLDGWGGGVCQASSTVYNAALLAGLEIEQRSRHRFAPLYVPPGRDAAVAYPHIDLKIRNPFPHAVQLRCRWTKDSLTAGFFAEHRLGPKPEIVTHIVDVRRHRDVQLTQFGAQGLLRNSGKDGFEAVTYRKMGQKLEFISRDSYPAMDRVTEYR